MERFAAVTMVYQDYWFLKQWLDYYGKQFGRENLYVLGHGDDPMHEEICQGANLIRVPRNGMFPDFDEQRWRLLSDFSSTLKLHYSAVICSDVDEVVVAHRQPHNLADVLSNQGLPDYAGAVGFEVLGHDEFDEDKPILEQARGFVFSSRYSKPCVLRKPGRFTPGAHGMYHDWQHSNDLVLLHLQFANAALRHTRKKDVRDDVLKAAAMPEAAKGPKLTALKDWAKGKVVTYQRTLGILEDGESLPFDEAVGRCLEVLERTMFRSDDGLVRVRPRKARFFRINTEVPEQMASVI